MTIIHLVIITVGFVMLFLLYGIYAMPIVALAGKALRKLVRWSIN